MRKYAVVDTLNLEHVPGKTARAKLMHLKQEGHLSLGVTEDGRGMYSGSGNNVQVVACRPPHCDDPTGQVLNVYDQGVAAALKALVPKQ